MHADALGVPARSEVLDDTGHVSSEWTCCSRSDRAARSRLFDGDVVLLVLAGSGCAWAASVRPVGAVRLGEAALVTGAAGGVGTAIVDGSGATAGRCAASSLADAHLTKRVR